MLYVVPLAVSYDVYRSPWPVRIVKYLSCGMLRWAGHVARIVETRNAFRILVARSEGGIEVEIREGNLL
jgi:hypothetical protein